MFVIFAWGTEPFNPEQDISYHSFSNRGAKQVIFLSAHSKAHGRLQSLESIEFTIQNVKILIN